MMYQRCDEIASGAKPAAALTILSVLGGFFSSDVIESRSRACTSPNPRYFPCHRRNATSAM